MEGNNQADLLSQECIPYPKILGDSKGGGVLISKGGIARRIWLRRNTLIHEGSFSSPNAIVNSAANAIGEFHQVQEQQYTVATQGVSPCLSTWSAPPHDWFKANWDAAIGKQSGWVGLAAVIRDSQGNMVAAKTVTRKGLIEPVAAEALAALMAVQLSREMGFSRLWLEGDAKTIVDAVNSTEPDWSRIGHLVDDIRMEIQTFTSWKVAYVRREANHVAHMLARMATTQIMDRLWTFVPPDCIAETIVSEQTALSD
ncbi:uncharacterized protein LOC132190750 [Corylus avellana]|uniref:uncharacterized protein LOC132190750 n=1 Tax=Corylus avellana TaxID=13451 RepID=UPI00286D33C0|nr:uncharacterized protein LOC132190750 [Corylus avellana]